MLKHEVFRKNLITKKIEHWTNDDLFHLKGLLLIIIISDFRIEVQESITFLKFKLN